MGISSGRVAIHFALWSDLCSIPMSKYQPRHRLWLLHGGGPHAYRMSNLIKMTMAPLTDSGLPTFCELFPVFENTVYLPSKTVQFKEIGTNEKLSCNCSKNQCNIL